ncbi:MAG TPA: hypothetical protein VIC29_13610 [Steroidobacteraceae bacterium]|jgi:hypothetical protein
MPLAMPGFLRIAYKLLVNDRAKFAALLVGISFAVFLMVEMTSLFARRRSSPGLTERPPLPVYAESRPKQAGEYLYWQLAAADLADGLAAA